MIVKEEPGKITLIIEALDTPETFSNWWNERIHTDPANAAPENTLVTLVNPQCIGGSYGTRINLSSKRDWESFLAGWRAYDQFARVFYAGETEIRERLGVLLHLLEQMEQGEKLSDPDALFELAVVKTSKGAKAMVAELSFDELTADLRKIALEPLEPKATLPAFPAALVDLQKRGIL